MTQVAKTQDIDIAGAHEVPEMTDSAALIHVIERAAINPDVDVEKMERLFAMHQLMVGRQAEQDFNEAMRAAQNEMPEVERDARNKSTDSSYSKLETVVKTITPVVTEHGFSLSFGTAESHIGGHYRVTCEVSHKGGHTRNYHADIPMDDVGPQGKKNKTAVHGFGSCMTYGRRYLTLLIFNIVLKDEDNDGNAVDEFISAEQKEQLIDLIKAAGGDPDNPESGKRFLKFMDVASVDEILGRDFHKARMALETKK